MEESIVEVRLLHGRETIEPSVQQAIHLRQPASHRHIRFDLVREANEPDGIPLFQCDIAQHQDRIQGVVQKTQPTIFVRHHTSTVQHENEALTLIGLELFDCKFISTSRRSPIDMLVVIVLRIVTQSFKVVVLAYLTRSADPDQTQPIRSRQESIFCKLLHVRINQQLTRARLFDKAIPKSKPASQSKIHKLELKGTASRWPNAII
jgi:hypothetical protein